MNTKVKLRVQGLTNSQIQSGAYALILAEKEGPRRIPIIVGIAEAQSIAIALEHIIPPRPLTHDLFVCLMQTLQVTLQEIFIYKFEEGVFYSELVFDANGKTIRIDSRTSDAISIALRTNSPIYTSQELLDARGVAFDKQIEEAAENVKKAQNIENLEPEDIHDEVQLRCWLTQLSASELEKRFKESIEIENYEQATMYRDELRRRQKRESEQS